MAHACRYDFTDGDLAVSLTQMLEYLNTYAAVPFKVLQFLFTEINYGGRVTDAKDRVLISNLVLNFCAPGVVEAGYAFSPGGTYRSTCAPISPAPRCACLLASEACVCAISEAAHQQCGCCRDCESTREFLEVIAGYPSAPTPEIFGLHANADITCAQNETYDLFATVLSLQPRVAAGAGASREDVIGAQCEAILAKLPGDFDVEAVAAAYPTRYEESMHTVLAQECIRCAALACLWASKQCCVLC